MFLFVDMQDYVANLFGKEAALFVASGTMGNLISSTCSREFLKTIGWILDVLVHVRYECYS